MGRVKYIHRIDEIDDYRHPRFKFHNIDDRFVKTYEGALSVILCLPDCPAKLIQYLSSKMSDENIVHHNKFTRENFNKYTYKTWLEYYKVNGEDEAHELALEKMYKDNTIKKAFGTLTEKGLLVPKTRGMYIVNPEFFFKKSESARLRKVKLVLEIQKGTDGVVMQIEGE